MAGIQTRNAQAGRGPGQPVSQATRDLAGTETADTYVVLRPKRQITLPKAVCEQLGIGPGDRLQLRVEGDTLVARPSKAVALEALRAIREAFRQSGITEEELLESGRRIREELARAKYGPKA